MGSMLVDRRVPNVTLSKVDSRNQDISQLDVWADGRNAKRQVVWSTRSGNALGK